MIFFSFDKDTIGIKSAPFLLKKLLLFLIILFTNLVPSLPERQLTLLYHFEILATSSDIPATSLII